MEKEKCAQMLDSHGVKPTANRLLVARALSSAMQPLSLSELCDRLLTVDKSCVFRVLVLFKERHLVHVIEDGSGGVRYELCHSHDVGHDDDAHAHFHCERCGRTFCLDHVPVPMLDLPEGYEWHSVNYLVKGVCPECRLATAR